MREACGTVGEALAGIRTLAELEAYAAGLRRYGAAVTDEEWQRIARRRIALSEGQA